MSNEQFVASMKHLRESRTGGVPIIAMAAFPKLGVARTAFVANTANQRPPELDAVVAELKSGLAAANQEQLALIQQAQACIEHGDIGGFNKRMEDAKAKAKQAVDAQIDQAYDRLIKLGVDRPNAQSLILAAASELSSAIGGFAETVGSALGSVQRTVFDGIEKAADKIVDVAKDAGDAIKHGAEEVGDAITSIFSGW
jgi:hypothetical protein